MSVPNISRYITCRQDCSLRYLEALAMNGFAEKFTIEPCEKQRFQRIRLQLIDGSTVVSKCFFDEEVRLSVRIIASYIGLHRLRQGPRQFTVVHDAKKEE